MTKEELDGQWLTFHNDLFYFIASLVKLRKLGLDIEDVLHDVYIRAHVSIWQLRNPAGLKNWLFQIAKNIVRNEARKSYRVFPSDVLNKEDTITVDELFEAHLDKSLVDDFIRSLPEPTNIELMLHLYYDMKPKEIAKLTGKQYGAVRKRIYRLKKALTAVLETDKYSENYTGSFVKEEGRPSLYEE